MEMTQILILRRKSLKCKKACKLHPPYYLYNTSVELINIFCFLFNIIPIVAHVLRYINRRFNFNVLFDNNRFRIELIPEESFFGELEYWRVKDKVIAVQNEIFLQIY